jgi:hypothetical protein
MDTTMRTAPIWSADPTLLDRELASTHTRADRCELTTIADTLATEAPSRPLPSVVDRLLARPTSFTERADTLAAINTLIAIGMLDLPLISWPGWRPDTDAAKRLLRPLEFALVRHLAGRSLVATTEIAALEAGAASGELPTIHAEHLRYDHDHAELLLTLPGTTITAARELHLAAWAIPAVTRLTRQRPTGPLLYRGTSTDPAKRESAVLMSVRKTLTRAGLGPDPTITPESVRNSGARLAYERAEPHAALQTAAKTLGITNLDRVAERIAHVRSTADAPAATWSHPSD